LGECWEVVEGSADFFSNKLWRLEPSPQTKP
jgi:hypothetical protein